MISQEILKKVKRLEIISKKAAKNLFAGEYHSAFKGRGMEFSEVREYQQGDDVRFIDWNVSSRMGRLFVKQFVEERELTIILAVDLSASLHFFSAVRSKQETASEVAAVIAFTAMLNNDKVGLLLFSDQVELFVPPKKGKIHLLRMIRDMLQFSPSGRQTSIATALAYLNKVMKKRAVVFLISDFLDLDFSVPLKVASQKHDLIAIRVQDPREETLPEKGVMTLADCESGQEFMVDFGNRMVRNRFRDETARRSRELVRILRRYGVDSVGIRNSEDYEQALFQMFMKRRQAHRR